MSKAPRKTMAEISAASAAQSDHAARAPVALDRPPVDHAPADHAPRHNVTAPTGAIATKRVRGRIEPDGKRTVVRREKPHTSIYMHPAAMRTLRAIAAAEDCKPHDVLLEGLRMVFARFGYDFDQLDRGE